MIVSLILNPAAFVVALLAMMGYGQLAGWPEESWIPLIVFFVAYVLAARYLPWWTRPVLLWRYWRMKRKLMREQQAFPTWPQK